MAQWLKNEGDVTSKVVAPLFAPDGAKVKGTTFKLNEDFQQDIVEVAILVALGAAKQQTPGGSATPPPTTDASANVARSHQELAVLASTALQNPSGYGSCAVASASKKPKALDKATWTFLIKQYEARWSPPRTFDIKIIYGADEALARMHFENTVTRIFTPSRFTKSSPPEHGRAKAT